MRILLVEDDAMIGDSIRTSLIRENYIVDWVRNGQVVETAISTEHFDLVLLDLGLPGKDGMEILRGLRLHDIAVPVIVITARDAVDDRIKGLDTGADDYLVKPFEISELAARVRSTLRRSNGHAQPEIELHGVKLCPATKEVWYHGEPVQLSAVEYAITETLMFRAGTIVSRDQLEERMYGWGHEVSSNAVVVHIHAIRRKLGNDFIKNLRGVGYFIPKPKCGL